MELLTINQQIERAINSLERRVDRLESQDQTFKGELMGLKEQIVELTQKTSDLQTAIGEEAAELKTAIDALFLRIKNLEGLDISPLIASISDSTNRLSALSDLTIEPDVASPSTPAGLTAATVTDTSASLSWSPSTDNVGVDSYEVFQDGVSIGNSPSPSFSVSGLTAGTVYLFSVRAKDKAGNLSPVSDALSVTTTGTV